MKLIIAILIICVLLLSGVCFKLHDDVVCARAALFALSNGVEHYKKELHLLQKDYIDFVNYVKRKVGDNETATEKESN